MLGGLLRIGHILRLILKFHRAGTATKQENILSMQRFFFQPFDEFTVAQRLFSPSTRKAKQNCPNSDQNDQKPKQIRRPTLLSTLSRWLKLLERSFWVRLRHR